MLQVGNKKHQPAKILKKKIKKKFKSRKTFLEKIYAKIKEFARVTLATRRGETVTEPSTSGQDNSETAGNQVRDPGAEPQPALGSQPAPRLATPTAPCLVPAALQSSMSQLYSSNTAWVSRSVHLTFTIQLPCYKDDCPRTHLAVPSMLVDMILGPAIATAVTAAL